MKINIEKILIFWWLIVAIPTAIMLTISVLGMFWSLLSGDLV